MLNREALNCPHIRKDSLIVNVSRNRAFTLAEGATRVAVPNGQCRAAFTLAEVLITLGIIGVVAAMTMPSLITNHQKKVTAKRLASAYSICANALEHAKAEYGDSSSWDKPSETISESTKTYVKKYFLPYINDYTDNGWRTYKNYYGDKINTTDLTSGGYFISLNNGVLLTFAFAAETTSDGSIRPTTLMITVDINNIHAPNKTGRDRFSMTFVSNEKLIVGDSNLVGNSRSELINKCSQKHSPACSRLIMIDGWEIKDDYPWKSL